MSTLVTLSNGVTAGEIRTSINSNFNTLNTDKAESSTVTAINTRLTTAENNIINNSGDIDTLEANLATLENKVDTFHVYEYDIVNDITVTDTTYSNLITLTTSSLPIGVYQVTFTVRYTLNNVNASARFRCSIDGGSTWSYHITEPKDITDRLTLGGIKILEIPTPTTKNIIIQAMKDNASDVLTVVEGIIAVERKIDTIA